MSGREPARSGLVIAIVIAILTACSGTTDAPLATWREPVALDAVGVVDALAESGVGVVADVGGGELRKPVTEPRSPLTLTSWQAERLAGEIASGGGTMGHDLDELGALAGIPDNAPPLSVIVGAWTTAMDTPATRRARDILGPQDWTQAGSVTFPRLVLLLFVADVVRAEASTAGAVPRSPVGAMAGLLASSTVVRPAWVVAVAPAPPACPSLSGWIDGILDTLFNALKLDDEEGLVGIFTSIWNVAVDVAKTIVSGILTVLAAPVLAAIKIALAVVGTISFVASFLVGWEIGVGLEPGSATHWAHPGQPDQAGAFVASVASGAGSFPDYIVDCAQAAGVALPDVAPFGKTFTWIGESTGGTHLVGSLQGAVGDKIAARVGYVTGREDSADTGPVEVETITAHLVIERFSPTDINALFQELVFSGKAGQVLAALLSDVIEEMTAKMTSLMVETASGGTYVGFHTDPEPTPTLSPSPTPTATGTPGPGASIYWPATIDLTYSHGFGQVHLENGWCKSGDEEGGYWQLWFVKPNFESFDIALFGARTARVYSFDDPTEPAFVISSLALLEGQELWKVNVKIDSLTLVDNGTAPAGAPAYTGPIFGQFVGNIYEDEADHPISGVFECFPG